ncbi:MAG: rod shape-determining protein MreC [Actinomycetota bacterium]|nr:rod shape-determining protein MreC [Actinomycetota bacterium]
MAVHRRASRRRYVLLVLVLTSVTLITLDTRSDDSGPLGVVGRAAHTVVSPVEKAVDSLADPLNDWWQGLTDRGSLKKENERLRRELSELEDERRQAQEALRENEVFEALAGLPIYSDIHRETARVVNRSTGNFEWTITLSKGSESGISPNMAVIGPDGVVGKVLESWTGGSKVRLLIDPDSFVSVRVFGSQVTGLARGRAGSDLLRLELDPGVDVQVGDDVVTSGLENSDFPAGLSVGEVAEVEEQPGIGLLVRVRPWTDFDDLELVQVLDWVPGGPPVVVTTTSMAPAATTTTPTTVAEDDE